MSYYCDCTTIRSNGEKGVNKPTTVYLDGICGLCHNYAVWGNKTAIRVDSDVDVTRLKTCVSTWHKGTRKTGYSAKLLSARRINSAKSKLLLFRVSLMVNSGLDPEKARLILNLTETRFYNMVNKVKSA